MVAELLSTSVETEIEVVDHDQQDEGPSALPLGKMHLHKQADLR